MMRGTQIAMAVAECRRNAYSTFLGIALHADPAEPRVHDIKGDIRIPGVSLGTWACTSTTCCCRWAT